MQSILVDAGPLIALFNQRDRYHQRVKACLQAMGSARLISTWPVLTEVTHMLNFRVEAQLDFMTWVQRGAVSLYPLAVSDLEAMITLTKKYQDVPMDFADSSLVVVAQHLGLQKIASLDSDYYIYRIGKHLAFENVLLPYLTGD